MLLEIVRIQHILASEIPPLERNTQCVPYKRVSQYSLYSYGLNIRIYKLKDEQWQYFNNDLFFKLLTDINMDITKSPMTSTFNA